MMPVTEDFIERGQSPASLGQSAPHASSTWPERDVLVVEPDVELNRRLSERINREHGYRASRAFNWKEAQSWLEDHEPQLVLLDARLPDTDSMRLLPSLAPEYPVIMLTDIGSVAQAVEAIKAGAVDYRVKPVNLDEILLFIARIFDAEAMRRDLSLCRHTKPSTTSGLMIGQSRALHVLRELVEAVAPKPVTVLIEGESGVGKELVAKEIHQASPRAHKSFVTVDCCSLQENLFESELFGHERGAFTGADRQKKGLMEIAAEGTVFLDEIGEISSSIQAKLLRVLETGTFRRLGGTKDLRSNARIITATNQDLDRLAQESQFRADLYFRLSTFLIQVPPLRERREDIAPLATHFLRNHGFSGCVEKRLSAGAMRRLKAYDWPGNIRELKNILERAIILSGDLRAIDERHLTFSRQANTSATTNLCFNHEPTLEEIQQTYLRQLLERYEGHRAKVAKALGISERQTYRLIQKYGLQD
jgi:DNA-binding NtrC family response regulator